MARKRNRDGAGNEEDDSKPVYLIVEHKGDEPSHSIVIMPGADAPGGRTTTIPLRHAKRGMSFGSVDSRWIVGVDGNRWSYFTIYDLATFKESRGGGLNRGKVNPVLIPHRGMLYVLSSRPKVYDGADSPPWFEAFIFRDGGASGCICYDSDSHRLLPPPVFPCLINPIEYLDPPDVRVLAYAVVGSRILLSVSYTVSDSVRQMEITPEDQPEEKGTCAFDVDRKEWEMVHHKNLPFLGEAVHLGGHLFAATRSIDGAISVYHMEILSLGPDGAKKTELRVVELTLVGRRIVPGQLLRGSGEGRFSTFDVRLKDPTESGVLKKVRIVHRTYSVTVVDTGTDQPTDAPASVMVKRRRRRIHKLVDRPHRLASPTPLVAALTL